MTDRLVPVEPQEVGTTLSTRAIDADIGGTAAAWTETRAKRHLGWFFWVCVAWLALVILSAIFANFLPLKNPLYQDYNALNQGPSGTHVLGTDDLGRDIFSRIIYGARVSLVIGFGAIFIGLAIGGTLGIMSGYLRGRFDTVVNAGSYVLLAYPAIVAIIAIVAFWGNAWWQITLILGVAASPLLYRVVRASTLSYSTKEFVMSARALGASNTRILVKEILPNVFPAIVSFSLIGVATVIVLEGSLAFLGLSVQPPTPSWGNMINEGRTELNSDPWLVLFPALAIFFFLLALNFVGDRLRQYFDVSVGRL